MLASVAALLVGTSVAVPVGDLFVDFVADCSAGTGTAALPFCSISEALAVAVGGDVIHIARGNYPEELHVNVDVELAATGFPGSVVVDGQGVRNLLTVEAGVTAVVSGLMMREGNGSNLQDQGIVVNRGHLTLRSSTISNCQMNACCDRAILLNEPGSQGLVLEDSSIVYNEASGAGVSAIRSDGSASLTIRNSSVLSNRISGGPVLKIGPGLVTIDSSLFLSAWSQTTAVVEAQDTDLVLRNSTITNTPATAILVTGGAGCQLIESSTLTCSGPLPGGSIVVAGTSVPRVRSSILGAGSRSNTSVSVVGAIESLGYNLVEVADASSSGFVDGIMGDQVGSISQPIDPMLGPPISNGGPTRSRFPLPGSPVVDAGHPTDFPALDQLGYPRTAGGADIGAIEVSVGLAVACPAAANSTGNVARMRISGSADVNRNAIELFVNGVPPGMMGLFLASNTEGFLPFPGGSSGSLCLGGSIGRFVGPGQVQSSGAEGQLQLRVDLTAIPQGLGTVAAVAGQYWVFQSWFRDSFGAFATSNFSSATAITF